MSLGWAWQQHSRNAGIVDVLWSAGLGASAITLAILGEGAGAPRIALAVLAGVWSIRLAIHLAHRVLSEPEDGRYAHLRAHWRGDGVKFFLFFQLQAALIPLFSLPFYAVARNPLPGISSWLVLGVVIWCATITGEAVADRQLATFRADPAHRGMTCRRGMWRYSRHPNYFFEWLHWFAYVALAIGSPAFALAVAGPVVMYVFLRWLSGIPYTEAQALRSRGEDYRDYQRTTPMLFPWFPRPSPRPIA
ncbi:MAG: DUF1295 domain-containing protein [Lysobacter sp.]|nr:MAG: DUF1295 domain-containing protein [Lysobacter sp.]